MTTLNDTLSILRATLNNPDLSEDDWTILRPLRQVRAQGEADYNARIFGTLIDHLKAEVEKVGLVWPWSFGEDVGHTGPNGQECAYWMSYTTLHGSPELCLDVMFPAPDFTRRTLKINAFAHVRGREVALWGVTDKRLTLSQFSRMNTALLTKRVLDLVAHAQTLKHPTADHYEENSAELRRVGAWEAAP